ncbi:hypothetical protein EDB87DRAFT_1581297 [Lactarius vividus]|nr:hypothetical protein EDB87DRAFT_1581297 [Lactarius vividus]
MSSSAVVVVGGNLVEAVTQAKSPTPATQAPPQRAGRLPRAGAREVLPWRVAAFSHELVEACTVNTSHCAMHRFLSPPGAIPNLKRRARRWLEEGRKKRACLGRPATPLTALAAFLAAGGTPHPYLLYALTSAHDC